MTASGVVFLKAASGIGLDDRTVDGPDEATQSG